MKLNPSMLFLSGVILGLFMLSADAHSRQLEAGNSAELWGGRGVTMRMTARGATLEFDCAHGSITEPIKPDAKGEFRASGTYTAESGGPVLQANPPRDLPATYRGAISGDTMRLEIKLSAKDETLTSFTLERGKAGRLVKCR